MPESNSTSAGFSVLESSARKHVEEGATGSHGGTGGDGVVLISQAQEMFRQEKKKGERSGYYPSQSAKSFLKDYFEYNPPTQLDPSHPTTSFSVDQMIQFARAVGIVVPLDSYSMLEELLLKARVDSGVHPVASRYPTWRSLFTVVPGSSVGDNVASQSVYSQPTITETESSNVVMSWGALEQSCSSRQADARLVEKCTASDSLKTLQQIKCSEKKKKASTWKWSRECRLNPFLPCGDEKGGYVFTEEKLELAPFAEVFARGPEDPLQNKPCSCCM